MGACHCVQDPRGWVKPFPPVEKGRESLRTGPPIQSAEVRRSTEAEMCTEVHEMHGGMPRP
jgi:hypothetical protein